MCLCLQAAVLEVEDADASLEAAAMAAAAAAATSKEPQPLTAAVAAEKETFVAAVPAAAAGVAATLSVICCGQDRAACDLLLQAALKAMHCRLKLVLVRADTEPPTIKRKTREEDLPWVRNSTSLI